MPVQRRVYGVTQSLGFAKNVLTSDDNNKSPDVLNRYLDWRDGAHTKHILKYIFPRQFGLHNPFTYSTDRRETTHAFKDYTDREAEIATAPKDRDLKVYKRLGPKLLPLIVKMQKLHKQCSFHALINHYCSSSSVGADTDIEMSFMDHKDRSKELTQKEISMISTKTSDDVAVNSRDYDIIPHHTPQHQVYQIAEQLTVR